MNTFIAILAAAFAAVSMGVIIWLFSFVTAFIVAFIFSSLPYLIAAGCLFFVGYSAGNYISAGWAKLKAWWNEPNPEATAA